MYRVSGLGVILSGCVYRVSGLGVNLSRCVYRVSGYLVRIERLAHAYACTRACVYGCIVCAAAVSRSHADIDALWGAGRGRAEGQNTSAPTTRVHEERCDKRRACPPIVLPRYQHHKVKTVRTTCGFGSACVQVWGRETKNKTQPTYQAQLRHQQ